MTVGTQKQVVVVLGMHRSGTSALTKSLELLGVGLGKAFRPALQQNPKGFWEDKDCLELNERLLADNQTKWFDLVSVDGIKSAPTEGQSLEDAAINLIKNRLEDFNLWGFKDPRTCRTIPFWKKVFQKIDCKPLYVIAIRNPLSVADSLDKRDGLLKIYSLLLWAEHTILALTETVGAKRVVVDYDLLIAQPLRELNRMAEGLGFKNVDSNDPKTKDYCDNFLEEGLRHNIHNLESLDKDLEVPEFIKDLYRQLRKVAEGILDSSDPELVELIKKASTELQISKPISQALHSLVLAQLSNSKLAKELLAKRGEDLATSVQSLKSRLTNAETKLAQSLEATQHLKDENHRLSIALSQQTELVALYKNKINEIFESKSWKLTQPLRRVADYSRALIRR